MSYVAPITDYSSVGMSFAPPSVIGLAPDAQSLLDELVSAWNQKRWRNSLRSAYVDGKQRLAHAGFSIPPSMRDLEEVVGWPAKAVAAHAERCMFDGFVSAETSDDPFELSSILDLNRFDIELPQAIRSSMIHSVAFVSVTPGDESSGEPPVIVMPHSAQWSAAIWDFRRRVLKGALVISSIDDYGFPTMLTLFTPFETVTCIKGGSWFVQDTVAHQLGHVPVAALPYRPEIDRPFGRSVVSRPVMSITDDAVRTVLRTEASAEFYSAPQLMLLGADASSFQDDNGKPIPAWEMVIGRINAISKDEDGDTPTVQQISQQSVQPHIEQMRELASRFAGETNVPVSSLGVVTDNPSSAEAMHAAEKDLVIDCAAANRVYGSALKRVAQDVVMIRDGVALADVPQLQKLSVRWRNPAMPSVLDAGDAMLKIVQAIPWIANTTVALEEIGFTDEQIDRLLSQKRRSEATSTLDMLLNGGAHDDTGTGGYPQQSPTTGGDAGATGDAATVGEHRQSQS
ncbi:phage portal protein [Bifidobacterium psychraerophilum]|uniref:phage portal protein n=1 Tax=Bifidobacterium psychraerophilum TaxID=218140 RepID=UPI0039EAC33A